MLGPKPTEQQSQKIDLLRKELLDTCARLMPVNSEKAEESMENMRLVMTTICTMMMEFFVRVYKKESPNVFSEFATGALFMMKKTVSEIYDEK